MSKFIPTQEQLDILEAFKHNNILKVNAVAGSGKSSTLKYLAENNPERSLYLCYNRGVAEEAREKFPEHVDCRTIHSLAFATTGSIVNHKRQRPTGGYVNVAGTPSEIVQYYSVKDFDTESSPISALAIATFAKMTVYRFENSSEVQITNKLLPKKDLKDLDKNHEGINKAKLEKTILDLAQSLWNDRINPRSKVLATHDTYLKLFHLSKPVLDYEIIYVDEAQDSNPCTLDIINNQKAKVVYVGDTYQSIYQFRYAVNAMESIDAPTKMLSKSFRYGQSVADVASLIIDEVISIEGNDKVESTVGKFNDKTYTKLFRTNAALLEEAVKLINDNLKVYCAVDRKDFTNKLKSAQELFKGNLKGVKHQEISQYSNWWDFIQGAEDDPELKRIQGIVEKNKTSKFIYALSCLEKSTDKADIVLTTAHKSKGLQWDNVKIADDFPVASILEGKASDQERNLFYVACTRAIHKLELPKLFII